MQFHSVEKMLPICNYSTSFILHFTWGMNMSSVEYYITSHVAEFGILIRGKRSIFNWKFNYHMHPFSFLIISKSLTAPVSQVVICKATLRIPQAPSSCASGQWYINSCKCQFWGKTFCNSTEISRFCVSQLMNWIFAWTTSEDTLSQL